MECGTICYLRSLTSSHVCDSSCRKGVGQRGSKGGLSPPTTTSSWNFFKAADPPDDRG